MSSADAVDRARPDAFLRSGRSKSGRRSAVDDHRVDWWRPRAIDKDEGRSVRTEVCNFLEAAIVHLNPIVDL